MFKVVYTRESERNLDDIFSYIAEDNNTHAVKVLQKIYSTISRIKLFPYI
jgi:plasmid stabilization system protein ParE